MKHKSTKEFYPMYKNRNNTKKWFPIGYAINIHAMGLPDDPKIRGGEWKDGNLSIFRKKGMYWINCIYPIVFDNHEAWGDPIQRPRDHWTTTDTYVRCLDSLEKLKKDTGGNFDIKALVRLISPFNDGYNLQSSGDWKDIPNRSHEIFIERVKLLSEKKQLGGWFLADEPFKGDKSRRDGKRKDVHKQLLYYRGLIEKYDLSFNNHPIHIPIRGNGNYGFDPESDIGKSILYLLNELVGVADYIHDDLYLDDFQRYYNDGKGPFIAFVKKRVIDSIKTLIKRKGAAINIKNKPSHVMWSQGGKRDGFINPLTGNGYLTEEQVRYQNYCSWINGTQGAIFWELTKSDSEAFLITQKVSYEAHIASKFLMNPPDNISNEFTIESSNDQDVQLLVRDDPEFTPNQQFIAKKLIMFCNNGMKQTNVRIDIPSELRVSGLYSIDPSYYWSYNNHDNVIGVGLGPQCARAFIVVFEKDD